MMTNFWIQTVSFEGEQYEELEAALNDGRESLREYVAHWDMGEETRDDAIAYWGASAMTEFPATPGDYRSVLDAADDPKAEYFVSLNPYIGHAVLYMRTDQN